jgi:hypothetical protein
MIMLPLVGLGAGFLIGDRRAILVTALLGGIGLALVAIFTDEIDGWRDPFVWVLLIVSLLTTLLGIGGRQRFDSRRRTRSA